MFRILVFILLFPTLLNAQSIIANPNFNTDLSGWTVLNSANSPQAIWDGSDFDSSPVSGSAILENSESTASSEFFALTQCINQPTKGPYKIGLSANFPTEQSTSGSVIIRVEQHISANCTGGISSFGIRFIAQTVNGLGNWQTNLTDITINNESAEFIIALRKTESTGSLFAAVDVAVLSYIDDVFTNGFE